MSPANNQLSITVSALPPVVSITQAKHYFGLGKTTLYTLTTAGEIQSLTIGGPGARGKRAFLTDSLLAYINRRVEVSPKLATFRSQPLTKAKIEEIAAEQGISPGQGV